MTAAIGSSFFMINQQGYRSPNPASSSTGSKKPRKQPGKKSPVLKILALVLLAACAGGIVFGVNWYNAYNYTKQFEGIFPANVSINGINLEGMTLQQGYDALIAQAVERQNSWTVDLTYNGHLYYTLNNDSLGIRTSVQDIYDVVMEAYSIGHTGNPFQRKQELEDLQLNGYERYTTQSSMTTEYLDQILNAIAADMYQAPKDAYLAYFDPNAADPFTIVDEETGRQLKVENARQQILTMAGDLHILHGKPEQQYPRRLFQIQRHGGAQRRQGFL